MPVSPHRIYLDNAATSFPKPEAVYDAVDRYQRELGAAVGRGATRAAVEVQAIVDRCRARAARLLGAQSPDRIVFTFNGTDGLNQAIHGLLRPSPQTAHVVTSRLEHNSVLRPLAQIGCEVTYVRPDDRGIVDLAAFRSALRAETSLVVMTHASNVTGAVQPIAEIGRLAHRNGSVFVLDAAQTAGHLPIHLRDLPVDVLACSGHKGLLGPLGTGLLYVRPGLEERLVPLRQGGTGTQSEQPAQPKSMPDRYESGNHNAPGLVGLEAALAWIEGQSVELLRSREQDLTARLLEGLRSSAGVTVYGPPVDGERVGVVSFNIAGLPPQEVALVLDQNFGIAVRAGFHCAPMIHECLDTAASGGTVRMSVGPFTSADEIDHAIDAVRQIAATLISA
ncbi:MAG: aminotransferase class V-fold PLP-dependent enzyme [Planctomycetaceae bacterium]